MVLFYSILSLYFTMAVLAIIDFLPRPARVAGILSSAPRVSIIVQNCT